MRKQKGQAAPAGKSKPGIFSLLKPYRKMLVMLVVLALFSNGVNLLLPGIIARGIDSYTAGTYVLKHTLLWFLAAALFIFVVTYLQSIVQTYASEKVARNLRTQLVDKISRQSYVFIQKANPSKLLTNLTSDVDAIKMFVAQAIVSITSSIFVIVGASILLLSINWRLGLVVLLLIPIIGITFFMVLRKVRALFKRSREIIDWLNKVINESILGSMLVRVINSQQLEYDKFLRANTDARDLGLSILRLFAALIPVIQFTANMAILAILALGGHFVISGSMSLGNFAAFNSYLVILIFPILVIGFMSNVIAQATASYNRLVEILDAPDVKDTGTIAEPLKGAVAVESVTINYGGKKALNQVSFEAAPGSKTAIIGPTAGGKSQLLYLLAALIQPDEGRITYDGHTIAEYNKERLHAQLGLVFQDSIIFNMSVRDNIAFNSSVTSEDLQCAIDTAELGDFIASLPQQLDTVVSERGSSLSGGQKQRIMLARALAINPRVLLLDDFTARVDTQTEQRILDNVRRNYPGITLISVTQKIAAVTHYEQIILLMEGEVIAKGTHEELLASCPEYIQIYQSQRSTSHYETVQNGVL
ncbi:ABC transporter ATP-binding protein [Deminuibacter soli]|uniref:ABC transporter ATP-binding protein n=1 Tax=Deminuibacter soli TaxID=2291815 RepID=A0A3E1NHE6_9BACT|nr:ABC transporter ATP-binding protein [Deminuibacter soli]RFM27373.1 ABC transporter ATP-binding protein [Deminuibacter soli]